MSSATLLARFLAGRPGIDFCDSCVSEVLRLLPSAVDEAVQELAARRGFLRDVWHCRRCGRQASVTRAVVRDALRAWRPRHGAVA